MRNWILAVALLLTLPLAGCDSQGLMKIFTPNAEDKAAQTYLEDIRTGDFSPVADALDPSLKPQFTADLMKRLQSILAARPLTNRKIVGSQTFKGPGATRYALSYEYQAGTHWLLAQIVLQAANSRQTIVGLHLTPMAQSLEQLNAFTLSNRGVVPLIFLAVAVLVPIFVIWTAIVCWRMPIPKRKWLWRIFVLIGITAFTLNWTSGNLQFNLVQVNLLGAAFSQQLYGPIILQVGFPLGAILFWIRRKAWLKKAEEIAAAPR